MNMKPLIVVLLDALLAATAVGDTAAKADKPSTWTRPAAKNPHDNPKLNTAGTWTPDPSQLLGEYEEPPPPRDTNAYFMTDNNTVVTVQVGMTADLRCQVFDVAEHETVSWIRRRDHHLITVGAATYSNDERFQVTYSENSQDWTLHVRYAQPRDAGVYECQLSAHPPIGVYTTLNVIEAKAEIEGESEIYVQTGSSVQLTCKLKDFTEPPTYVFWFHAEHMVNYDSNKRIAVSSGDGVSELRISKVTKQDSGNYTCQPANARPASVSLHVITGETPAAMQRASATEIQYRVSLALISTLVALIAL
ncbi:zwei Ig domain protein zig-8-like isoform X1 [Penaeus japonicus]|uniref:zwei Ig domain protein zig-8-like isoform X1 n=1 Tax=Penaeus japonicus TaxID=27405 RepID=UPI001C714866|nr:zwei Ig domain protein zig-8-like isoform X1 [Penaeus japonicus]